MKQLIALCNKIVKCIIEEDYDYLERENALIRVSKLDIIRVVEEYGGTLSLIPDEAFSTDAFEVYKYNDNSGYKIDLDLWIDGVRSDLTLQLEVKTDNSSKIKSFIILDILVL